MVVPPWEAASEELFVLITGANSGVGLGIGQRLITQFLATRSLKSHLVLIITTRTAKKSRETVESLRSYLEEAVQSPKLRARAGPDHDSQSDVSRVHLLSVELDLCKLPSVYTAADRLLQGKVRDPTGKIGNGEDIAIPRIDVAILNAGVGGWEGVDWAKVLPQVLRVGIAYSFTYPVFKKALPSSVLPPQEVSGKANGDEANQQPRLGEVFCANLFGHYLLAHELVPLMSKDGPDAAAPGRVIWTSTIDADEVHLDFDDFQALRSVAPYESSKRITDLLCLEADLPRGRKASAAYFASSRPSNPTTTTTPPRFYLSHPGVVITTLFPLNAFLFFWYTVAMYLARLLGSPWHPIKPYLGACAVVFLALAGADELAAEDAQRVKWGSASDRLGRQSRAKKTEVDGWGWEGRVEDAAALRADEAPGILRKLQGRKWNARELTDERRARFDEDAVRCWAEMERLRIEWEGIMGRGRGPRGATDGKAK